MNLVVGSQYRLLGVTPTPIDFMCLLSTGTATGFIDMDGEVVPVDLSYFGDGLVGDFITFTGKSSQGDASRA